MLKKNIKRNDLAKILSIKTGYPTSFSKKIISQSNSNENMLWIYSYDKKTTITLTFIDYKLFKIEE